MRSVAAGSLLAVLIVAGCSGAQDDPVVDTEPATTTTTTIADPFTPLTETEQAIVIRGQAFSENETLAQVYGQYLDAKGYPVEILPAEGRRAEAIEDLRSGAVGMIVDYLGGSQAELAPEEPLSSDPDETLVIVERAYAGIGATVLDYARAHDDDAFVVRGDLPARRISDVRDLDLVFGAAAECFDMAQCYLGYVDPDVYGITFADTEVLEFGPPLGIALSEGVVDAVQWNATAPQIVDLGLKVLEDDLEIHPAQNVIPVIADDLLAMHGDRLARDVNSLSAIMTTEVLREWNADVDIFGMSPAEAARTWLEDNRLLSGAMATASNVVAELQRDLRELGYYTGSITGVYSLATEDAVLRFQIDAGLPPTGRYDEATAAAIQAALDRQESQTVIEIQTILADLGWYTGPINGVYTPETVDAIRRFQAFLGVPADGVVGPQTITAYETLCGDPADCRRPPDATAPPATTAPPQTTAAPATTNRPPATTAPPATTTPPPTTVPPPTTPPPATTAPPAAPTVRLISDDAGLDEEYTVVSCESDPVGVRLTASNETAELVVDDDTITLDDGDTVIEGTVENAQVDADGTLVATGTFDVAARPAWELSGTCATS